MLYRPFRNISRKTLYRIVALAAVALLIQIIFHARQVLIIGAAYKAKILCSGVFVSKRDPGEILREDLEGVMNLFTASIDRDGRSVTASFPGLPEQRAVHREGLGCALLAGASESDVRSQSIGNAGMRSAVPASDPFARSVVRVEVPDRLREIVASAFDEPVPDQPVRTRAVIVLHRGRLIAERYAPGITAETPLPGWSMAKSVTNALVGILVKQGKLALDRPVTISEWAGPGDPRSVITLDHLLHMSSGLAFEERAGPFDSDVNRMLLRSPDAAAYARAMPLKHEPGTRWQYSSGTTNIVSWIIRNTVGGSSEGYHRFPRTTLFDRIGMRNAVLETDAAGTFVGSSFIYASARDWARFGQLYLNDGTWAGERILPVGWVRYSITPTPASPNGRYGAHFWTNGGAAAADGRPFKRLPADAFYASGYEGQFVVIVPSCDLVVVRLGQTRLGRTWDMESFVSRVIGSLPSAASVRLAS